MLEIIYEGTPVGNYVLDPAILDDPTQNFEGGRFLKVGAVEGTLTLADGDTLAFGISPDSKGDVLSSGKITAYIIGGVYRTDEYDPAAVFTLNAAVYVNASGQCTATAGVANQVVGVVTKVPTAEDPFLGFKLLL